MIFSSGIIGGRQTADSDDRYADRGGLCAAHRRRNEEQRNYRTLRISRVFLLCRRTLRLPKEAGNYMISDDRAYMQRAIDLARGGEGWVHPNPLVGAVIVKEGRIIGAGYHERYGQLHAERNAIASLTEPAEGATLYVTLEPCCHHGKTPPCTDAIIGSGISRVIIGSRDPNPMVAGKGAQILREHGIEVVEDFMREECDRLNEIFFHYITEHTPYVIMKYAMTADGSIATKTGASKWITDEPARRDVQMLRNRCMGIMVGIGTVLRDDPMLNCRLQGGRDPVRIICDSSLRIPEDSQICRTAREQETIVVCAEHGSGAAGGEEAEALRDRKARLEKLGVRVLSIPGDAQGDAPDGARASGIGLKQLMKTLGEEGIDSILLEGGGRLNESALREGIVHEIHAYIAPKIFGGGGKAPVDGEGVSLPDECVRLTLLDTETIGPDLKLRYRVLPEGREGETCSQES